MPKLDDNFKWCIPYKYGKIRNLGRYVDRYPLIVRLVSMLIASIPLNLK
jgi:hypothetical protein